MNARSSGLSPLIKFKYLFNPSCHMAGEEMSNTEETSTTEEIIEPPVDSILQLLVTLSNSGGFSVGITLWVKGTVITGDLVGFTEYMDELASMMRNPDGIRSPQIRSPPEPGDEDEPRRVLELIASGLDSIRSELEGSTVPPSMIHLKNVGLLQPDGQVIPFYRAERRNMMWRGPLHTIDGFILGKFGSA